MPTYYLSNSGNDGTAVADNPNLPFLTFDAVAGASGPLSAGDTLVFLGSEYRSLSEYLSVRDGVTVRSQSRRGTVLRRAVADSVGVLRTSNALPAGQRVTYDGLAIDGEGVSYAALELAYDSGSPTDATSVLDVLAYGGTNFHIYTRIGSGVAELHRCAITGPTNRGVSTNSIDMARDGDTQINVRDLDVDGVTLSNTLHAAVFFERFATRLYRGSCLVENVHGTVVHDSGTVDGSNVIVMAGLDAPVVRGGNIIYSNEHDVASHGVHVYGATGHTTENAVIADMVLQFNAPRGHGIKLGLDGAAQNDMVGGGIFGNHVTGQYYADKTPHNITLGQETTGGAQGNVSVGGYVGLLASITRTAQITGNLLFDNYGPSLYLKGTIDAVAENNICVVSTNALQRDLGVLCATYQLTTDMISGTFENNTVIVQDPLANLGRAQPGYLAAINRRLAPQDQVCAFTNNTYIVPDTVQDSDTLFLLEGTAVNLAGWLADPRVTGDKIIKLPQTAIDAMVESYRVQAQPPGSGAAGASILRAIQRQVVRTEQPSFF